MRLTQHDASFLYSETASGPMHMTSFAIVEGELSRSEVLEHVRGRIHLAKRLRQRLVYVPFNLAHPKWIDDPDFVLDDHIAEVSVAVGSSVDDAIAAGIEIASEVMPRDKPLWRFDVITGVEDRTVILQRIHHAMVDGASAVELSLLLFDLQRQPAQLPPETEPWNPPPLPTPAELAAEAATDNAKALLDIKVPQLDGDHGDLLRRAGETMARFVSEPVITAPWNAGAVGPKRKLAWHAASFGDLRQIRRVFGGTLNDVVLAVFVEAAARYLEEKGESTQDGQLRLMCPVNVRREGDEGAMGNQVSALFPMFKAQTLGVIERLKQVRWETERLKQNRDAHAMSLMMDSMPELPPVAMAPTMLVGGQFDPTKPAAAFPMPIPPQFGPRMPNFGINFTLTNVPGVQTPQYLAGREVLDVLGMMMLTGNLGYGVAIYSYNQRVYFNLTGETRLMPDVERMRDLVVVTYDELLGLSQTKAQIELSAHAAG